MKNKNGFTLIEIIGVVTVLSIILIVAVPSLTRTLKKNQQNKYNDYIDNLKIAAENYVVEKLKNGETVDGNLKITLGDLIDVGYVKEVVTNPENEKKLSRRTNIVVSKDIDGTFKYTINEFYSIPKEYQEVEYIESSGTQYIDTGLIANNNTIVEIEYIKTSTQKKELFGSYDTNNAGNSRFAGYTTSTNIYMYFGSFKTNEHSIVKEVPFDTINKLKFSKDGIFLNNNLLIAHKDPNEVFTAEKTMLLFATNGNEISYGRHRISRVKIYIDGNTLSFDGVPCYKNNDEIGLYDTVNDVFYTNKGTGTFIKGADV